METQNKVKKDHWHFFELMCQSDVAERLISEPSDIHLSVSSLKKQKGV